MDIALTAERVNRTSATIKGPADFRADKVAELKTKVDSGAYKVNSRDVAEKMLAALSKEQKR